MGVSDFIAFLENPENKKALNAAPLLKKSETNIAANFILHLGETFGSPNIKIAIGITRALIVCLKASFSEDLNSTLKKELAYSELMTAKEVIYSLEYEEVKNIRNGLNRAITHIESAFTIYVNADEFSSSCICASYLSGLHWVLGNRQPAFYIKLWERIPLTDPETVCFDGYYTYTQRFVPEEELNALLSSRKNAFISNCDKKIEAWRSLLNNSRSLPFLPSIVRNLEASSYRLMIEFEEEKKRKVLNITDNRSTAKKFFDITKPWWWSD